MYPGKHNFARMAKLAGMRHGCRTPAVRSHCCTYIPIEQLNEVIMSRKINTPMAFILRGDGVVEIGPQTLLFSLFVGAFVVYSKLKDFVRL